jgi:hypothetical protein
VLNLKLNIFYDLCAKAGVTEEQHKMAFAMMLRGKAQTFYYQHLASTSTNLTFTAMLDRMRAYFHTPENHQLFLNEWRTTMLKDVIASNPDKDLAQCLEIVIEKLQRTYQGLVQNFGASEGSLAGQLVSACQGVPACATILIRPATTFEGVASELRSAVGIWMRCNPGHQSHQFQQGSNSDAFYTDRRYNRNARQPDRRPPYNRDSRRDNDERRPGRYQHSKKCFICGKQGCWSTRHPQDEQARSRQRFRTYAQDNDLDLEYSTFLTQFEGIDINTTEDSDEGDENTDLDVFCAGQQFNTTVCWTVNGHAITTILSNAATAHAITGIDPYDETKVTEEPCMFTFDLRYGVHTFQGIMPDTGAAGISTAGKTQVIALQQIQPVATIDESTAGRHRIRFGDNPECVSLGDVKVKTPFGTISFAVMPTNTPFLLCLADMDRHGIYLNNIDNVLMHKNKAYPVVRKWGHPWLLLDNTETAVHYLTETELRQLHRRFGHPAADRLYRVLEKAGCNDVRKDILDKITKFCHQCQMHSKAPGRFKFTIRDDADFNHQIIVDVMYINQKPVLHAVDEATGFHAARFLQNMTATTT